MRNPERRRILQNLAIGVAGGIGGLIHQALAAEPRAFQQGIRRANGDVQVNGKPARNGTPVRPGDVVTTGARASAVYVMGDNAFFLRANSQVDMGHTGIADFLRVVSGGLLSVFGKGNRQIATTTATIGIRGTGCYIEAEPAKSYFCLCYGEVELTPTNGQPLSYRTSHHERPLWIENGVTAPASVVNHTDAEVIMLEALVGRRSPFPPGGSLY